jgi:hypothetical protein
MTSPPDPADLPTSPFVADGFYNLPRNPSVTPQDLLTSKRFRSLAVIDAIFRPLRIQTIVWGERVLRFYGVPTVVFVRSDDIC